MKKKATCQVEFEFEWSDENNKISESMRHEYIECYLAGALEESGYPYMTEADVTCLKVEDVE